LSRKLTVEFDRLNLPYFIPKQALVKQRTGESAYSPDVLLIDPTNLVNEPLWEKTSTVTQGDSVPLVIEVVSTNWRVDYYRKYSDYEEMGIKEYWIVDYQPFGAAKFVGEPKQPTISVCSLVGDEYEINQFRNDDQIISHIFPELNLTANQILLTAN
jgi:Uma2 family endonuclease